MLSVAVRGGEDFGVGGVILSITRPSCYPYIHQKRDPYSPRSSADRGRYFMHIARKHLPSPLMGEGSGGWGTCFFPPSPPSPARGEGVFTLKLS
jgi:hypothetical protein